MTFKERYASDSEFRERKKRLARESYQRNREREQASSLAYYYEHREQQITANREWKAQNQDRIREAAAAWKAAHPDAVSEHRSRDIKRRWADPEGKRRQVARVKLAYAVRSGKILKPDCCSRCSASGPIEAHHENYDEPFVVVWLCRPCHRLCRPPLGA